MKLYVYYIFWCFAFAQSSIFGYVVDLVNHHLNMKYALNAAGDQTPDF